MNTTRAILTLAILLPTSCPTRTPRKISIIVRADKPGARINPAMWGVFFEDINGSGWRASPNWSRIVRLNFQTR
jgi:hypothetical protein